MRMRPTVMALVGVVLIGCGGESDEGAPAPEKATVNVTVTDPGGLLAGSATQQLFLFDGDCPKDDELAYGKVAGAFLTQSVPQIGTPFVVSNLEKKKACFVAMLRKADCAVSAFGATPADLNVHTNIVVQAAAVQPPLGACDTGLSCVAGACK